MTDKSSWSRIESLFDAAVELDGGQRLALLERECKDDAVRAEVLRLLDAADASAGFLAHRDASAAAAQLRPGTRVGEWCIGKLLGRGGMGEVYEVQREGRDFQQRAALKLLTRLDADDARRRFADERRILARLQHPGIAHLLDGGEHGGRPYAVMEHVDGVPLTVYAAKRSLQARIGLFLQVCAAVSHAHQHLVVHRDLKPNNVMVTPDGRVKLLDFGIAKPIDVLGSGAATQVIRASPDYCAPEQLRGDPASAATDVYALGVILFELLTGQRLWQFGGLPLVQALERLSSTEPPRPSDRVEGALRRTLRGDLDSIVLKALRSEPGARYASVEALAQDLLAWRELRPVQAREGAATYRIGRALKRYRWWVAAAAAVLLSLLLGLAGTAWQAREAAIERDLARREAERADAVRQYLMLMFRTAGEQQNRDSLTAKAVLDTAATRVHDEFAGEPQAYADIVLALAELYFSLDDYTGARPLLERLLRDSDTLRPETRAMAQHDLAQVAFRSDRSAQAMQLLADAQGFWQSQSQAYRDELAGSRLLQSQLERVAGNADQALRTLEAALPERLALSGLRHRETGKLVNNLGAAYVHVGRYDEAIAQFEQATTIWQSLGLERSADALNTLNNWAAAEMRRQRPDAAVPLFQRALALRRELYPPSAALAALINNLGKTLSQLGRDDEALPLLREAAAMGAQYAGAHSVLAMSARLGVADALSQGGATAEAGAELDALAPTLIANYGASHLLAAMLEISRARLARARGDHAASQARLDAAAKTLQALGAGGAAYLPQIEALRRQWSGADASPSSR